MTPYGSNLAGSFRIPQQQGGSINPQSIIDRGLAAEQELIGQAPAEIPDLPTDLQNVQGQTEEVAQKWAEIKNFANTLWHNYRINVTRPDVRDPRSVRAAEAFKKGMADLQYSINSLKRGQENYKTMAQAAVEGKGSFQVDPTTTNLSEIAPEDAFYNTEQLAKNAQMAQTAYAKPMDTRTAVKEGTAQQDAVRASLMAIKEKVKGAAKGKIDEIASGIQNPVYEAPQFNPNTGQGKQPIDPKPRLDVISYIKRALYNNDQAGVSWLKNQGNINDVERIMNGVRITGKSGKVYNVDFGAVDGGYTTLNEAINDGLPAAQQVPSDLILPYVQALATQDEYPPDQSWQQVQRLVTISQNMTEDAFGVSDVERNKLRKLLKNSIEDNKFVTTGGEKVTAFEIEDNTVTLQTENKIIEYDLTDESDLDKWRKTLYMNAGSVVDWDVMPKVADKPVNTIPTDLKPNMTRDEFKKAIQGGKGGFNFDEFIKNKSK